MRIEFGAVAPCNCAGGCVRCGGLGYIDPARPAPRFDPSSLRDMKRDVYDVLSDGHWHTDKEIQRRVPGDSMRVLRELRSDIGLPVEGPVLKKGDSHYRLKL